MAKGAGKGKYTSYQTAGKREKNRDKKLEKQLKRLQKKHPENEYKIKNQVNKAGKELINIVCTKRGGSVDNTQPKEVKETNQGGSVNNTEGTGGAVPSVQGQTDPNTAA